MKDQNFYDGNKVYTVPVLIERAKDLVPFEIPLKGLNLYKLGPFIESSMRDFVGHMKQVLESDLSYPIILDEDGYVMDGRHRIAKALLKGRETILAVRFDVTPDCDYIKTDPKPAV